jgi:hypothetical protein
MVASTTRTRLRQCLGRVNFPASRDDLLYVAQRDGHGDDETVQALRAIAAQTYTNFDQVCASVNVFDGDVIRHADAAAERRSHGGLR